MANVTVTTACPTSHIASTQAPVVREKKIFHLFHFTQPMKITLWGILRQANVYMLCDKGQLFSNHYTFIPTDNQRDTNLNRNICSQVSLVWIHKFNRLVFKLYFTKYSSLKEEKIFTKITVIILHSQLIILAKHIEESESYSSHITVAVDINEAVS